MKVCFCCKQEKDINLFHKHSRMKDGHLNKCAACVTKAVAEWRKNNPDCRKKEHARSREKEGHLTFDEWAALRRKYAIGRKVSAKKYATKRRRNLEKQSMTELDEFVMEEAFKLAELRTKLTGFVWHVDHIVPLFHKEACGLNNAFNLQVVPAPWNVQKGNRNMNKYWGNHV